MASYPTPGVYREEVFPARGAGLPTGVPAFLGLATGGDANTPRRLTLASQLAQGFGPPRPGGYLAAAVAGFFANGGEECFVVRLAEGGVPTGPTGPVAALAAGLASLAPLDDVDLVVAPDLFVSSGLDPQGLAMAQSLQTALLAHCATRGDRFALLDAPPADVGGVGGVLAYRNGLAPGAEGAGGALYHPWLKVAGDGGFVPPSGHVAGIVARSDRKAGVHKAPANEVVAGAVDLAVNLTDAGQAALNPAGVNALRAFPGRGIRVWGARTLSTDPAWTYINVRRLFSTAIRWIEQNLGQVAFEPNDPKLWTRIGRELRVYFEGLFRTGALKGRTPAEAFYVKCDAETNPPEAREAGRVVTEIGLAPVNPNEFVVVRIVHGTAGAGLFGS
jgi:phage tail sheath protein FI